MLKILDSVALLAYCGLIFWLSDQQRLPMPTSFEFQDKFLHTGAYAAMAIFSWRALRHWGLPSWILATLSFLFCSLYGLSDEWHQSFIPGRESSGADWLADSLGAGLAVLLLTKSKRVRRFFD